ncbi:hypothetical protein RFI_03651 [Reticulomyxa filosa]|uniref:Uncharacterized protein n=1 Tax=Reticulomyxa filosa TaxID=46433 RepID=X6P4J9_RETFI|nr:hypothetical protein RFI_03651 [Reticulomyxa filosa]|eukprot:ETO33455.1 hypothetical protein RFI_03651 [Reticulomyxa filosa]
MNLLYPLESTNKSLQIFNFLKNKYKSVNYSKNHVNLRLGTFCSFQIFFFEIDILGMSSYKAYVNDEEKVHTILLHDLTMEHLKQQILQATQPKHAENVTMTIVDRSGSCIESDENVIQAFKNDAVNLTVQFQPGFFSLYKISLRKILILNKVYPKLNKVRQPIITKDNAPEALGFKKYWNIKWRKANAEAAKTVEEMLHSNKQGLIVVTYNTLKWKNRNDNHSSIIKLISNEEDDIRDFGEYRMYIIRRKCIVLERVNIDGNVYVIDCKLECKEKVSITIQIFVTKNAIVDEQLKQSISSIPWNTKIHHDIPIQLQDIEDKGYEYENQERFNEAFVYLQEYLQIAIDIFGLNHHYVAIAYNKLGTFYDGNKGEYEKAIDYFSKAQTIISNCFGSNCYFLAKIYENVAFVYEARSYAKAIEYHTKALEIKLAIFGANHVDTSWSYENLGNAHQAKTLYNEAVEDYEIALKIMFEIFGINHTNIDDSYSCFGWRCCNINIANIFWQLGIIFEKLKNDKQARKYFKEAWRAYSIVFGEWSYSTSRAKEKVESLNQ